MPTILENLNKAIEVIEATPAEEIDLGLFMNRCGTLACAVGTLAMDEFFKAQGLHLQSKEDEEGEVMSWELICRGTAYRWDVGLDNLDNLFGENAFDSCFATRDNGTFDEEILHDKEGLFDKIDLSDKQLALQRLYRQRDLYAHQKI